MTVALHCAGIAGVFVLGIAFGFVVRRPHRGAPPNPSTTDQVVDALIAKTINDLPDQVAEWSDQYKRGLL